MPSHKPQISLRRPSIEPALAERFVSGLAISSDLAAASARSVAPASEDQAPVSEQRPSRSADLPTRQADVQASGHLAVVGDTLRQNAEHPDIRVAGHLDAQMLSPGIVRRRSGRLRRKSTVYFEPQLAKRLAIYCATQGVDLSDFVEGAVRAHFETLQPGATGANSQVGQGRDAE